MCHRAQHSRAFADLPAVIAVVAAALIVCVLTQGLGAQEKPSIVVRSVKPLSERRSLTLATAYGLTRDDLYWLKQLPGLQRVVPIREHPAKLDYQAKEVRLVGTIAEYAKAHGIEVTRGRFLTTKDEESRQNVAVISDAVAREMVRAKNPLGRHVRLSGQYFTIVGVIEGRPEARHEIFLPLGAMQVALGDMILRVTDEETAREQFELSAIEFWLEDGRSTDHTVAAIRRILKKLHYRTDYSIATD